MCKQEENPSIEPAAEATESKLICHVENSFEITGSAYSELSLLWGFRALYETYSLIMFLGGASYRAVYVHI